MFLKIVSMYPISLPAQFNFLSSFLNIFLSLFWYFVTLHIAVVQILTVRMNMDKSLDEYIDHVLNGGIYTFGFLILCFCHYNRNKLVNLMNFVSVNFRQRSANGNLNNIMI